MRYFVVAALLSIVIPVPARAQASGPADPKAQKTYNEAMAFVKERNYLAALDCFKKADKQDGGHCLACQRNMIKYGVELQEWKTAEGAAEEMVAAAQGDNQRLAVAQYQLGMVVMKEALARNKDELFARVHEEMSKALAAYANFPEALYLDGLALAHLRQDEAAKAQFQLLAHVKPEGDPDRQRALLYIAHPELARARMAPPFALTTMDGRRISLDDLKGKVVLIDFWATWCGPCREALPHIHNIVKHFEGQPLVVLSVSLDSEPRKWEDFVSKNEMTWPQYCDGGFTGPISRMFGVKAIPHTFTIDADGILQDEHIGDASIEGKLKKLLARARELETAEKTQPTGGQQ
jgi:thiol-disulfide isomerase/thioredoxin